MTSLLFVKEREELYVGMDNGVVGVWNVASGGNKIKTVLNHAHLYAVKSLVSSPAFADEGDKQDGFGDLLLSGGEDGRVKCFLL